MKVGIMQPYFLPYIGYWQLMNAVDKYVIYDDVNFIKGGWINRNRILVNGQPHYFNVPMLGASPNKLINEVQVNNDPHLQRKNLCILKNAYSKAPYFSEVYPLVEQILGFQAENIAQYIINSFVTINKYLSIDTELIVSSTLNKDTGLRAQDKVIAICKLLNADQYYNAIGGQHLYFSEEFIKHKIQLYFVKSDPIKYKQYNNDFQDNLSILDVMMFNSVERVKYFLTRYTLLS